MKTTKTNTSGFDHKDIYLATFLFVFWMAIYIRTLAPGLLPGDSGEFQILAYRLGHAHTTGYAIYLLLAKLITFLPLGEIAFRVNLFSALMAGVTLVNVYLIGRLLWGGWVGAFSGSIALGISSIFWSQAVIAEVYTAASAFSSGILLFILIWHHTKNNKFLIMAGCLGGLSTGVHANVSLMAPTILLFIAISEIKGFKKWLAALGGAFIGLMISFAAFMILDFNSGPHDSINAIYKPAISSWDLSAEDLDSSLERLVFLVSATQWRTAMFRDPAKVMPLQALKYLGSLPRNFSLFSLVASFLGIIYIFVRNFRIGLLLALGWLSHIIYNFNYSIGDIYVFYIPTFILVAVLLGGGLNALEESIIKHIPSSKVFSSVIFFILFTIGISYPFLNSRLEFIQNAEARFPFTNFPTYKEIDDWHHNLNNTVKEIEENAIVFSDWHNLYPLIYVAMVEEFKPEIQFVETKPYSTKPGLAISTLVYIEEHIHTHPIFAIQDIPEIKSLGLHNSTVFKGPTRMFKILE